MKNYAQKAARARHIAMYILAIASATLGAQAIAQANGNANVDRLSDGLIVRCDHDVVQLQVWDDRIVRIRHADSGRFTSPAISAVIGTSAAVPFETTATPTKVGVKTAAIEVSVDRASGTVSFVDAITHRLFLAEAEGGDADTTAYVGTQIIHGRSLAFIRQPNEAIIGLGQHQAGQFNYLNARVHLQQTNTEIAVPVLTSTAGYTLLWDNASMTDVQAARDKVTWSSENGDTIDYYVCYGPDLNRAIAGYRKLTGDVPLFGRWVWGLWQSRERYHSQLEILAAAAEYRKRHIPIDGIVQDWQYWSPHPWGSHEFGPAFPDPARLVRQLHDWHYHAMISVWAKFDKGSKNYDELEAAGNLYPPIYRNVAPKGEAKWYDAFRPQARRMYWRQIWEQLGVLGWDGWWLDATEPELGGRWNELRELQTGEGPGYAVFNAYALRTTQAVFNGQKKQRPEVRPFILTRSAYAGQQRNGAVAWSGDIGGNWQVFKHQIPAGLNFVASGLPYWNTDTGGFFGGSPSDPDYRELFIRWFQYSTFCPLLRIHGTGEPKPLWAFGTDAEKILLTFDNLRYRLLPYIYSTSWQVTQHQASMMRPLLFDYRNDPNVYGIGDQFLFGPALLVCPVTERSGTQMAVIPSAELLDRDGRPGGLSATYYQGTNFDREVVQRVDASIDFDWDHVKREGVGANLRKYPIPGLVMDHFSARWEGFVQTQQAGTYRFALRAGDGMRLWLDGKLRIEDWRARDAVTREISVPLQGNARVPIRIEYFQDRGPATINLKWLPPAEEKPATLTRKVYLPAGTWYDFWTGNTTSGGRIIDAFAPIEHLPLFVKAGSILPLGPQVQYAQEKPDAPLEIRVYRGADGSFTLYDDAGDGDSYEHGEHATIDLLWNNRAGILTIAARTGSYPGMPQQRQFRIVFVNGSHGAGPDAVERVDRVVNYNGTAQSIFRAPQR